MLKATALLSLLFLSPRMADSNPPLGAGARVRILIAAADSSASGSNLLEATYVGSRDGRIWLRSAANETLSVPIADTRQVEIARQTSRAGMGAGLGFMGGFALGAVLGARGYQSQKDQFFSIGSEGQWMLAYGVGVGLVGVLVGATIGASHRSTRWERVNPEFLGGPNGSGRALELAVSMRF